MVAEHYSTVGVGCRLSIVREATCVCMCVWDRDAGNIQGLSGLSTQFCHEPKIALKKVYFLKNKYMMITFLYGKQNGIKILDKNSTEDGKATQSRPRKKYLNEVKEF